MACRPLVVSGRAPAAVLALATLASLGGPGALPAEAPSSASVETGVRVSPYRESNPDGSVVDWLQGQAAVRGRALIKLDITQMTYFLRTKEAALEEGRERLLKVLATTPVDASEKLGERPGRIEAVRRQARRHDALEVPGKIGSYFEAVARIPLWGDGGILELLLDERRDEGEDGSVVRASGEPPAPDDGSGEGAVTGLIVDATGLGPGEAPSPALLPRILDESGTVLYDVRLVDQDFARHRGLAAYAVPSPGAPPLERPRQGATPLIVKALPGGQAGGEPGPEPGVRSNRADIVISAADAARVREAAAKAPFLLECRVLVLLGASPSPLYQSRSRRSAPPAAPDPNRVN